jgi:hypothetical protein
MRFSAGVVVNSPGTGETGNVPAQGSDGLSTTWDRRCDRCRADLPTGAFHLLIDFEMSRRSLDFTKGAPGSSAMFRLCAPCVRAVASWISAN